MSDMVDTGEKKDAEPSNSAVDEVPETTTANVDELEGEDGGEVQIHVPADVSQRKSESATNRSLSISSPCFGMDDAILTDQQVLRHKNFAEERRMEKDLLNIADPNSLDVAILVDVKSVTVEGVTTELVNHAFSDKKLSVDPMVAEDAILCQEVGLVDGSQRGWQRTVQGAGYVISLTEHACFPTLAIAFGRLAGEGQPLGGTLRHSCRVNVVVLVMGPPGVKSIKNVLENARNIAVMLSSAACFNAVIKAATVEVFREVWAKHVNALNRKSALGRSLSQKEEIGDGEVNPYDPLLLKRTGRFAGGLVDDVKKRAKVYCADFTDIWADEGGLLKLMSATLFIFCSNLSNAVAFGALNNNNTIPLDADGTRGTVGYFAAREMIITQALCGILWSFVGGQPLIVLQTTGPLSVMFAVLFSWSESMGFDFLPFYAWTGIWLTVILLVIAVTDVSAWSRYCDLYTQEVFALLVAVIFIYEAIKWQIKQYIHIFDDSGHGAELVTIFLLGLLLWFFTYSFTNALIAMRRSPLLNGFLRLILSEFASTIAIVVAVCLAYIPGFVDVHLETLVVSDSAPTMTSTGRPWLVDVGSLPVQYIFLAILPALLLSILFFLDHNITGLLTNRPENKLFKGTAYHLDFLSLAVITLVCSLLGLPWCHGALPFSPMHARTLADVQEDELHGRTVQRVLKSRETRVSNLLAHVLILFVAAANPVLEAIPVCCLYGFFLYIGVDALQDNSLYHRLRMWFTDSSHLPANHFVRRVKLRSLHLFTLIQLLVFVVLWLVKSDFYVTGMVLPVSLFFPFIIFLIMPFRSLLLPKIFNKEDVDMILAGEDNDYGKMFI